MKAMPRAASARGTYLRGQTWWIIYSPMPGAKPVRESARTTVLAEALALLEKRRVQGREGTLQPRTRVVTIQEIVEEFTRHNDRRRGWVGGYEVACKALTRRFGRLPASALTTLDLERWQAELLGRLHPTTARQYLRVTGVVLRCAKRWGMIQQGVLDAYAGVKQLKLEQAPPPFLPREDWAAVEAACPQDLRPMVVLALHTGLRRAELLGLRWGAIDRSRKLLTVVRGKGGKVRSVPLSAGALRALAMVPRKIGRVRTDLVFSRPDGSPYKGIPYGRWRAAQAAAGVEEPFLNWHGLRHSFVSALVASGVDLVTVKELAGHASIQQTMRYAHLAPGHRADAVRVLDVEPEARRRNAL